MKTITLANLATSTEQEVFDYIVNHLLTQNAKSQDDGTCLYLNPEGLKCAAGCLIADNDTTAKIIRNNNNDDSWDELIYENLVTHEHRNLIAAMQVIHDNVMNVPSDWPTELENYAHNNGLTYNGKQTNE